MSRDDEPFGGDEETTPRQGPIAPLSGEDIQLLELAADLNSVANSLQRLVELRETVQGPDRAVLIRAAGQALREALGDGLRVAEAMIERGERDDTAESKKEGK
jgi:hypothetical protein